MFMCGNPSMQLNILFYSELSLQPKAIGLICGLFKKKVTFVAEMS